MIDRDAFFEKVLNDNLYFDSNLYLFPKKEYFTTIKVVNKDNLINFFYKNKDFLLLLNDRLKEFGFDVKNTDLKEYIKNNPDKLMIDIDYEELEFDKEFYSFYMSPNHIYEMCYKNKLTNNKVSLLRLENKGKGLYEDGMAFKLKIKSLKECSPEKDKKISIIFNKNNREDYKRWKFAFEDEKQIYDWYDKKALDEILKSGVSIMSYEVDKGGVIFGENQVLFLEDYVYKKTSFKLKKSQTNRLK